MRTIALIILSLIGIHTHSQSKKDQILVLSNRVDSLSLALDDTKGKILTLESDKRTMQQNSAAEISLLKANIQQLTDSLRIFRLSNANLTQELHVNTTVLSECMTLRKELEFQSKACESELENLLKTITLKDDSLSNLKNKLLAISEEQNSLVIRFEVEVVNKATENLDERLGDDTESCLLVFFNDLKVDRYCDFGVATLSNNELPVTAFLNSDFAEKAFVAEVIDNSTIKIYKTKLADGLEETVWTKLYKKLDSGKWVMNGCSGNCDK
jgi:hypothetical protein